MIDRFAAPGQEPQPLDPTYRFAETVDRGDLREGAPWDQFLDDPHEERLGICCSGGGVRSASYALGALQVLREEGVLNQATHLAAVSGGDYMTVAHAAMVSETLKHGHTPVGTGDDLTGREAEFFGDQAPWARDSPEEQHLRNHTTYLSPGMKGKAWLVLSAVYGMLRHMVPIAAWITLAGALFGMAFSRWVGPTIRDTEGHRALSFVPEALALAGLALVIGGLLLWRQHVARKTGDARALDRYQRWAVRVLAVQAGVALLGIGLPALLLWIHHHNLYRSLASKIGLIGGAEGAAIGIGGTLGKLFRRGAKTKIGKKLLPKLTALGINLIGPVVVGLPFVAVTYFVTRRGTQLFWPLVLTAAPVGFNLLYWIVLDETTSSTHLFYRERLATAFVGMRTVREPDDPDGTVPQRTVFRWGEPDWREAINLSATEQGQNGAKLPNLVVCAAVNISDDVIPPGRLAGSFTFERDYSGGPLTGYVPTAVLEQVAGEGVLTLPAMMAISGAALSPSMGKMTRPWARLLLALFNARLGVWLPNPLRIHEFLSPAAKKLESIGARRVREYRPVADAASSRADSGTGRVDRGLRRSFRPGSLYVFREALGLNRLGHRYVYVTDGGHWENLGLVELLRRGCGQILCFDAAGDDIEHFHTLSEAIALARSDLAVDIDIDLSSLRPDSDTGVSEKPYALGTITYPDGTRGVLIFAKAALDECTPQDCRDYRERVPRFPAQGTIDQWFDDRQFESYRALGAHAAREVLEALKKWQGDEGFRRELLKPCEPRPS